MLSQLILTFDEFAKVISEKKVVEYIRELSGDLTTLCPLEKGDLQDKLKEKIKKEAPLNLDRKDIVSLILYWHYTVNRGKKELKEICEEVKEKCKFDPNEKRFEKLIQISLAQSFYEIYYGLRPPDEVDPDKVAPLLINKPLKKRFTTTTHLLIPVVPIISIFSTYILALVNELLKIYKQNLVIEYWWNPSAYKGIEKDIVKKHLEYSKELKFESYRYISEKRFLSFVSLLLLSSHSNVSLIDRMKIIRRTKVKMKIDEDETILHYTAIKRLNRSDIHNKLLGGELGAYLKVSENEEQYDLIALYAEGIIKRRIKNCKEKLILIGRLPDLLLTEDILKEVENDRRYNIKRENIYLMAYLPFPFEQAIRNKWPFYVSWYSPFAYTKIQGNEIPEIRKEYTRKLIISTLMRLKLNFLNTTKLEKYNFDEILSIITNDVFRVIDDEMDRQLQYIF